MPPLISTLLVALHALGAAAWVGGQLALAPMTRAVREAVPGEAGRALLRGIARRAQPVLWAGFAVSALSGLLLWHGTGPLLGAKVALAVLSAAGAAMHTWNARRGGPAWLTGAGAAVALVAGLGLVVVGAALRWS